MDYTRNIENSKGFPNTTTNKKSKYYMLNVNVLLIC